MEKVVGVCIVCGKELKSIVDTENSLQPNDGIFVITDGNYGSKILDTMGMKHAVIHICDDCLEAAMEKGRVPWYESKDWKTAYEQEKRHNEYYVETLTKLLDGVAGAHNIKSTSEFTCKHYRELAEVIGWKPKKAK